MSDVHVYVIGILLAWLAGIRVYFTVFGVGIAGVLGWVELPEALQVTQSWWVLGVSAALAGVEFFTDKLPGVDSIWDLLQTLARIPAGAFLAAATLSPDGQLSPGMLAAGAGVALASHGLKTGTRAMLNMSPEPVSNWMTSLFEDGLVVTAMALALAYPWLALGLVVFFGVGVTLLVWIVWRFIWRRMRRLWKGTAAQELGAQEMMSPVVEPQVKV